MNEETSKAPTAETPRARREALFLSAVFTTSGRSASGRIRNVSSTGALLETSEDLSIGETIIISFRGVEHVSAVIKRKTPKGFGIRFEIEVDPSACHQPATSSQLKSADDFVLNLRETDRRPIWDNHDMSFKRPKLR